jgi:hypothetical protein
VGFPLGQLHFQQGVAEELPLADSSQDVVISTLVSQGVTGSSGVGGSSPAAAVQQCSSRCSSEAPAGRQRQQQHYIAVYKSGYCCVSTCAGVVFSGGPAGGSG